MEIVRPDMLEHEALEIVRDKIGEVKSLDLELLPCQVINLSCDLFAGDEFYETHRERLCVNCLSRVVSRIDRKLNAVKTLAWEHVKLSPRIDREETTYLARKWLVDELTGQREVIIKQTESSTVFEKKLITVDEDSIEVHELELYYFPFYHIEGDRKSLYVDATTGEIYNSLMLI